MYHFMQKNMQRLSLVMPWLLYIFDTNAKAWACAYNVYSIRVTYTFKCLCLVNNWLSILIRLFSLCHDVYTLFFSFSSIWFKLNTLLTVSKLRHTIHSILIVRKRIDLFFMFFIILLSYNTLHAVIAFVLVLVRDWRRNK